MSKLRSISTAIWSDSFIEELSPAHKLLFIYLLTNEKTNMLGIYEASIRKISFETGIKKETIEKGLELFETLGKVKYRSNHIILVNFLKHQNFNTNMKKSAIDVYNNLPKELKDSDIALSKNNPSEAFETLSNHLGMVRKIEVEVEYELEEEKKQNRKDVYRSFSHLSISTKEFNSLRKTFSKKQIDDVLDAIQNYSKNTRYKSLFLTAKSWLSKPHRQGKPEEDGVALSKILQKQGERGARNGG